jgi:hypothetical protein
MKKILKLFIILLFTVSFISSQPVISSTTTDTINSSNISSEKASNPKIAKKTIVQPKPPTNWSRIKDLFR